MSGENPVRRYITQRLKDKMAFRYAGMRQAQLVGVYNRIAEVEKIDVDWARDVSRVFSRSAQGDFDLPELAEQLQRLAVIRKLNDRIQKTGSTWFTADRLGFVNGRRPQRRNPGDSRNGISRRG